MCKGGTGGNPQPVRPVEINKFKGRTIMAKEMIAMILAGGQGSRLYALTQKLAKPAVPFGGKAGFLYQLTPPAKRREVDSGGRRQLT